MITYYIYVVYTLGFCSCLFWHDMRIKLWPCFFFALATRQAQTTNWLKQWRQLQPVKWSPQQKKGEG